MYEEITVEYLDYTTLQGDTFDMIAIDFYGDPNQSYVLINANPDYANYIILDGGITLKIPIIPSTTTLNSLPPWKVV